MKESEGVNEETHLFLFPHEETLGFRTHAFIFMEISLNLKYFKILQNKIKHLHEHGHRHRPHTSWNRCDESCSLIG